jgi:hypothetical protein
MEGEGVEVIWGAQDRKIRAAFERDPTIGTYAAPCLNLG